MSGDAEETVLEDLLARALELQEQGQTVDVAALCEDHPHLQASVAAALGRVSQLARLHVETAEADAFLGRLLARRYRLDERVGSGAMGVVYRAFDLALDREVAVKLLRPELLVGERMDVRLAREGQVLAGIRHQNVVTVFDRGQAEDGRSFLVMELLRGHNASRLLRNIANGHGGPVNGSARAVAFRDVLGTDVAVAEGDVRQVVRWIVAAAEGLQAAHDKGVVHRDVKPSNLFLERGGRVVLLDFGIVSSGGQGTLGSDGSPFGTPAYMAPEQLQVSTEPDPRSDVYSLAATLYHLLTGRAPFEGTVQQVLAAIPEVEPPAVEQVRPGLPGDLAAIVEKGMAKDPALRYASARELRDDLQAWLEFRPVTARRAAAWLTVMRRAQRSPRVRTAVGMLLLLATILGGWQWSVARAAERSERYLDLLSQVPISLVDDLPDFRATSQLRTSAAIGRLLDELVVADPGTGCSHALRALHRCDCGDLMSAARDFDAIVAMQAAPFASSAAAACRRGEQPTVPLTGEHAPPTRGTGDRCAAVLFAMRAKDRPSWVESLLEQDDGLARIPGFAELHLAIRQRRADAVEGYEPKLREFERLAEVAASLEAVRRRASAIAHVVLLNTRRMQFRIDDAMQLALEAQRLAPECFVPPLVLGSAALVASRWREAIAAERRAIALQPATLQGRVCLVRGLIGAGDFDEVERVLAARVFDDAPDGGARRAELRGTALFRQAMEAALAAAAAAQPGDADESRVDELAQRAREQFRIARAASGRDAAQSLEELLCDDLVGEPVACAQMLELLAARPLDPALLDHVAMILPDSMGPEEVAALSRLMQQQAYLLGLRTP